MVRPDVVTRMVDRIIADAMQRQADCIVTACAMCHMNLEIRTALSQPIPVLHFSELLALATGDLPENGWFERHLIDPRPMLHAKQLM